MNYVIIGNSAAAVGCIEGIRKMIRKIKLPLFPKKSIILIHVRLFLIFYTVKQTKKE